MWTRVIDQSKCLQHTRLEPRKTHSIDGLPPELTTLALARHTEEQ